MAAAALRRRHGRRLRRENGALLSVELEDHCLECARRACTWGRGEPQLAGEACGSPSLASTPASPRKALDNFLQAPHTGTRRNGILVFSTEDINYRGLWKEEMLRKWARREAGLLHSRRLSPLAPGRSPQMCSW
ncbi:hypothetical protein GUJ93_ZPchr0001g29902 [Zizania palustris]|uniref:Uncharacterized protein n=1 Tax=Zizania palustris TaxID=103762 RepID=A0A8J5RPR9_ZIZPA|nr:hypothetical protein GUJ93_ZPchr0001g29902 [Zizania palustris]